MQEMSCVSDQLVRITVDASPMTRLRLPIV